MDIVDLQDQWCCVTIVFGDPEYGGGTLGDCGFSAGFREVVFQ